MARNKQVLALASLNVGHRRTISPGQSRQMQNFFAVGQAWAAVSHETRASWQILANQMRHDTGLRTPAGLKQKRPMNAFQCFASVNGIRLTCGQTINTVAPLAPARPDPLPPVLLTATAAQATDGDATTTGFTLTLSLSSYADYLQVYAAAPLLAGQYPAGQNAVIIATITNDIGAPINLSAAYQAKFGPLVPGQQVALTLVPVSQQGFKGVPLSVSADVQPATTQAAKRTNNTPALKAA